MILAVPHPLTGELLPRDDFAAISAAEAEADKLLSREYARLRQIREARDVCRMRMAELNGNYKPPPARQRTAIQQRVAECPRCTLHH